MSWAVAGIDAWITREPEYVPMVCPKCGTDSEECAEVDGYFGHDTIYRCLKCKSLISDAFGWVSAMEFGR
jgi:uncharacterized Zn finger protein